MQPFSTVAQAFKGRGQLAIAVAMVMYFITARTFKEGNNCRKHSIHHGVDALQICYLHVGVELIQCIQNLN